MDYWAEGPYDVRRAHGARSMHEKTKRLCWQEHDQTPRDFYEEIRDYLYQEGDKENTQTLERRFLQGIHRPVWEYIWSLPYMLIEQTVNAADDYWNGRTKKHRQMT